MQCGSGSPRDVLSALRPPSPRVVVGRPDDDPHWHDVRGVRRHGCAEGLSSMRVTRPKELFSPFVLTTNDSESGDADPSRTSLALPDRLAGDQQDRPLQARRRPLRALPTSAWSSRRAARGHRWHLVGCRDRRLARRPRPAASPATGVCAPRRHSADPQARLSGNRAPQPRPDVQRPALAQSRGFMPAVPHDPRRSRTPPAPLVECLPSPRVGRPLHRALRLAAHNARSRAGELQFVLSSMKSLPSSLPGGSPEGRMPVGQPCLFRSSAWSKPFRCTGRSR